MRGQNIERVQVARNLGVSFDSELRFGDHVEALVKSCFYRLKILYKIRNLLNEKSRITICESLILSRLNYADLVYGPRLLKQSVRMIQRVQNACCRFCFSVPPRAHITPYLNAASMLKIEARRQLHLASLMFEVVNFNRPDYLFSKIKFSRFALRYPRKARLPLENQMHKTAAFTGSFRYCATKCWNNIPPPLRQIKSKQTFKKKLKILLLEVQKQ